VLHPLSNNVIYVCAIASLTNVPVNSLTCIYLILSQIAIYVYQLSSFDGEKKIVSLMEIIVKWVMYVDWCYFISITVIA